MAIFERKEFKFYVPMEYADSLRQRILGHMEYDPFCEKRPENNYTVRSIYYDTNDLKFYYEKMDGLKYRKKLRVRVYNDLEDSTSAFLEIKRKSEDTIFKERAAVPIQETLKLTNGANLSLVDDEKQSFLSKSALNKFVYLIKTLGLEPKALITYEREAFHDPVNPDLRVTFDFNVRSCIDPTVDDYYRDFDLRTFADKHFVLEVKFRIAIPLWLRQTLKEYQLHLQSISKYCNGLDEWQEYAKKSFQYE